MSYNLRITGGVIILRRKLSNLHEGLITWKYNRFGHLEVWEGTEARGESDLYIQSEDDVEAFFDHIGIPADMVDPGDWDTCEDPDYF